MEQDNLSIEDQFLIQFHQYKRKAIAFDKQNNYIKARISELALSEDDEWSRSEMRLLNELNAVADAGTKILLELSDDYGTKND